LKSAVHKLTSIISHKKSNSSALSAVIEVTVETIVVNSAAKSGKYMYLDEKTFGHFKNQNKANYTELH
jgi:hypothetical protein